jgi:hypothetical protein
VSAVRRIHANVREEDPALQTAAEATARSALAELDEHYRARRRELEQALTGARSAADDVRNDLLYRWDTVLEAAVSKALTDAGCTVTSLDADLGSSASSSARWCRWWRAIRCNWNGRDRIRVGHVITVVYMTADDDAAMALGRAAHAKLEHGFEIRDRLRDLLAELGSAARPLRREDNSRSRSRMVQAQWVLDAVPDYTKAALLMGDFIHNLRAAMDYAVWAVTPQEVCEATPTKVAFPLYSKPGKWTGWSKDRKNWFGPTVFKVLESYQPFNADDGQLHPLHILQFLSNTDKHQLFNIVATSQVDMGTVKVVPEPPGGVKSWVNNGVVEAGSVLARVEFLRPDEPDSVTLQPTFAYEQVFRYVDQNGDEHWLTVGDAMNAIGPQVVEAVGYVLSAHVKDSKDE